MLQPLMASFICDDDLLRDVIKFFFMFGKNKLKISGDFLMKNLAELMDDRNKALLESKTVLNQEFDLFYKYLNAFIDDVAIIPKDVGNHIEFKHNRSVVWSFLQFLTTQDDNFPIKKTVALNHLKNCETYFDSQKFCRLIDDVINELSNEKPFTMATVENTLFVISKLISIHNFVKVNNVVVQSINRVVSENDIAFDTGSLNDIQAVIDNMNSTSLGSSVDELILDEDSFNLEVGNLNYPIVPVTAFSELKFFQEKRVFIFVGASGVGKSMILCHIASEMWLTDAYKKAPKEAVFYFTMENLKEEVTARIVANAFYARCGLNKTIDDVVNSNFTSTDKNMLRQKMMDVNRIMCIEYLPPKVYGTIMLRNLVKKQIYERGVVPYAIIVDYLDLLRCENKRVRDEHQELGEVVNELKALAGEFSVPVITVSHLNAEGCKLVKEDMASLGGRQMGKSLRKYENADVVCFVDEENTGLSYNTMNFFVSKHRYARKIGGKIYEKKYLPEYAYLGALDDSGMCSSDSSVFTEIFMENSMYQINSFVDPTAGL